MENPKGQLNLMENTLSQRPNLPGTELVRWTSGGLALQGIYKTSSQRSLLMKREELLSVPENYLISGPIQGTQKRKREFTSRQEESIFIQNIEKLGFSTIVETKGGGWRINLEAGLDLSKHSEFMGTRQSQVQHTYYCVTTFYYVPMASCHFLSDQLHFSKAALQELKQIEELIDQTSGIDNVPSLRYRIEAFFQRFGSHANQGPLHLGGIYWWKATSEGFSIEQLAEVKQKSAEALDDYIKGSYSGFGVNIGAEANVSDSHSKAHSQSYHLKHLQTTVQLSIAHTGGPPEASDISQWKAGLAASNQTWCVIDRGLQLVPIWDIILSNHRRDFKDPLKVATCLKDSYTDLTGLSAMIHPGEDLLNTGKEARAFLEEVKSWEVSDPEEQLEKLITFMQWLNKKMNSHHTWINICLTEPTLQDFLVNTVNFCKNSSTHNIKLIKSQLQNLLDPHISEVANFPQGHSIIQWVSQSESQQKPHDICQFSELVNILKEIHYNLLDAKTKLESSETMDEAQRKATREVSLSLLSFLIHLQKQGQSDIHFLILYIAAAVGYDEVDNTFRYLLGYDELHFLEHEIQSAHNKYQELKNICNRKAQAFLVLQSLIATSGVRAVSPEEKTHRLDFIRKYMEQSLSKEVMHVITKHGLSHDWENLEKDLKLLIDGKYEPPIHSVKGKKESQNTAHKSKQTHKPYEKENDMRQVIDNKSFLELLGRLGLESYYPKGMSRDNFQLIVKTSVYNTQPSSEQELPFYFLQKLQMLDCGLRYLVLKGHEITDNQDYSGFLNQENETFDPFEDVCEDSDGVTDLLPSNVRPHIHPMDIQMAILHCADDFARQYILGKLSVCQFALPLLIPNPCNSQIEFSLWSLSQIRRSWQQASKLSEKEKHNYQNQQMCRVTAPVVSFIRVGSDFSASKSQIMNSLLSKNKHDVFFHRHCKGSTRDCVLMGGVVEICWFCPGEDEDDRFDKCVAFTNLHGDAKQYKQQLNFLLYISSIIVLLMATSGDDKENREFIQELSQASTKPLIFLFDDREKVINKSKNKVRIGVRNRNEAELTEELTVTIRRLLELSDTALSLEDCARVARSQGFTIDEDRTDCKEAKEKADALMTPLRYMNKSEMKEQLLPLQGQLWHEWCEKDKELYHLKEKGNRSIEQHKCQVETEKQKIREKQLCKAQALNDFMKTVLELLQNQTDTYKLYFLQWMSVVLDNLTAQDLETLYAEKMDLWTKIEKEKQNVSKSEEMKGWKYKIEVIGKKINSCTLGVEHILREIGQIYEALEEGFSTKDDLFLSLPEIAAELMISGVPIELMDGEASYVPLKWVTAIFDKISEKLGDKRLFVLSVLGLQSSGKSTLLNALFGLQFAVSAGRCTQGAYMQLLKVEETCTEELGFDFLLVVDTEGLRAPELSSKSQNRDNELATFVIGLGNLTLINIFGENPSEIQDILQIVVQAFLRMKHVKISPSCLFVHQNVEEVTAKEQTMEGRLRLVHRLDEMASIAAEQENYSDIACFSDVIKFDVQSQVFYFAHLWDGNPPTAPPNPRYSHNIQTLKSNILRIAKEESTRNIMKISDIKFRVQDLWRALLNENFIFSFRNTREVMAMSKLEIMYNSWSWKLRSHVLDLHNKLINQIQNGKIQTLTASTLEIPVTEKYEIIKQELETHFSEDPDSEILVQWKANFENKLIFLKETLVSDSQRKARELISFKKSQEKLDSSKAVYEKEILKRSRELASSVNGTDLSEEELQKKFNQLWIGWVTEVSSTLQPAPEPTIDKDAEDILLEHFQKEPNINETLSKYSEQNFQIDYDNHICMNKKYYVIQRKLEVQDKETINITTNHIVSSFNENISHILGQNCDYNSSYFHTFLKIIDEGVERAPSHKRYTFTNKYKIDLSMSFFKKASQHFKQMHRAFKTANHPKTFLESKKNDFFMSFKISCQGATSIKAFVDFLWQKLTPAVSTTLQRKIVPNIAGDIRATCPAFNGNRSNLEKHILISLAEEENFDNYWQYLHDPESFFKNYIENQIRRYFSENGCEKRKNFLKLGLEDIKNAIYTTVHVSTTESEDKNCTVSEWLDSFCDHLGSDLIFPRKDLINIEHQEIKDVKFLKQAMIEALDPAMKIAEQNCLSVDEEEIIPEIGKILSEHLCGCWKRCPFCGAICTNTIPNHDGDHSVPFHRPQCVTGWKWIFTDNLSIDFCTSSVASECHFILGGWRMYPYKNYRLAGGEYATWSITPDTSTQPYWKWFVCHFRSELENRYKNKFQGRGEIPVSWDKITKQHVLDDLKK